MIDWKALAESGGDSALFGALGHIARLSTGQVKVASWWREGAVLISCSLPFGYLGGQVAVQYGFDGYLHLFAAIVSGILSQLFVKKILQLGPGGLLKLLRGG